MMKKDSLSVGRVPSIALDRRRECELRCLEDQISMITGVLARTKMMVEERDGSGQAKLLAARDSAEVAVWPEKSRFLS